MDLSYNGREGVSSQAQSRLKMPYPNIPVSLELFARIFIPPKGSEVEASNRKNKHKSHWSEILKVKQKLSQTTFKIESLDGTKCYSRTRTNIARASAIPTETNPRSIPSTPETVPSNTLNINDIYLIKEQQTDTKHYLGRYLLIEDEDMVFQIIGTYKESIAGKLYHIFTKTKGGRILFRKETGCIPFTFRIPIDAQTELVNPHVTTMAKSKKRNELRLSDESLRFIRDNEIAVKCFDGS